MTIFRVFVVVVVLFSFFLLTLYLFKVLLFWRIKLWTHLNRLCALFKQLIEKVNSLSVFLITLWQDASLCYVTIMLDKNNSFILRYLWILCQAGLNWSVSSCEVAGFGEQVFHQASGINRIWWSLSAKDCFVNGQCHKHLNNYWSGLACTWICQTIKYLSSIVFMKNCGY